MVKSFENIARCAFQKIIGPRSEPRHAAIRSVSLAALLTAGELAAFMLMTERPARAYVDPGSGLLALQAAGASLLGGLIYLRYKLRRVLGKSDANVDRQATDAETEHPPAPADDDSDQSSRP